MRKVFGLMFLVVVTVSTLVPTRNCHAQMDTVFDDLFGGLLIDQLSLSTTGGHQNHFIPAADLASETLTPALNRMVVQSLSSLPLSSTIAGTVYEKVDGSLRKTRTSWGPIFAETGATIGKGGLNFGVAFTSQQFSQFRGLNTEDIRFSFTHEDIDPNDGELGTLPTESDIIDVVMDLDIAASVFSFTGTYGLMSNLDIGIAVPIIDLTMEGKARATISSFTYAQGNALHIFGGTSADPILTASQSYSESVTGIGDVAVRAKYSFKNTRLEQYGMLVDLRLPTGAEEDFLGSGETNLKVMGILSRTYNRFTPHLNLAYGHRGAEAESDEVAFAIGFDQSINSELSFAFDILGLTPLDDDKTVEIGPGSTTIVDHPFPDRSTTREIDHSNIPIFEKDNIVDASFGFRWAPKDGMIVQANLLIPMNDGGLRSDFSTTLGIAMYR